MTQNRGSTSTDFEQCEIKISEVHGSTTHEYLYTLRASSEAPKFVNLHIAKEFYNACWEEQEDLTRDTHFKRLSNKKRSKSLRAFRKFLPELIDLDQAWGSKGNYLVLARARTKQSILYWMLVDMQDLKLLYMRNYDRWPAPIMVPLLDMDLKVTVGEADKVAPTTTTKRGSLSMLDDDDYYTPTSRDDERARGTHHGRTKGQKEEYDKMVAYYHEMEMGVWTNVLSIPDKVRPHFV